MKLLWIVPLWVCAAVQVRADVTVRYKTDIQLNLPGPAKEAAQKAMQSTLARFSNVAFRMKNGKAAYDMGSFTLITDYPAKQVTLLDREHKTFSSFTLADYTDQVAAAMPEMPEDARKAMENVKTSVETKKTGRTDTILGIQVEEREAVIRMQIPTPPEHPGGMTMKLVMRIWTAASQETLRNQAVREFTGYRLYANALLNPAAMMQKMTNLAWAKDLGTLVSENAMMLRMQMETYIAMPSEAMQKMGMDPDTPASTMTQEAAQVSSDSVDQAMFEVPADYQKVEAGILLKSMIAGAIPAAGGAAKKPE